VDAVTRAAESFARALAQVLRAAREESGLSQTELATRSGLSQPHVGYLEQGKRGTSADSLKRIAFALGTTATELVSKAESASSKR
jgi:transcriptional regulator with XRE-family HTH domain